jgi:hypothetical protein
VLVVSPPQAWPCRRPESQKPVWAGIGLVIVAAHRPDRDKHSHRSQPRTGTRPRKGFKGTETHRALLALCTLRLCGV